MADFVHVTVLFFVQYLFSEITCYNLESPEVFDPVFYANNHPDINGIETVDKAKQHWLTHGLDAGLRGAGHFHSKQYLERYPDLSKAFGHNYRGAIEHYLQFHQTEHRIGISEQTNRQYEGRWTVTNNEIFVGCSTRTAGAIDSLSWNNKEFINSWDHGRQLQMACNTNKYTECYNPTEAGGVCDGKDPTTHSRLDYVHVHGHVMTTQNHPAFWKPVQPTPGTNHNCDYGAVCPIRQGYWTKYQYPFSKKVTVGTHGINNCIEFIANFTIAGNWQQDPQFIQMESPAVYMTYEFTKAFTFNPTTRLAETYHSVDLPVILSTSDHQYALGAYAPPGQDTDRTVAYSQIFFSLSQFADTTGKFNVVFYKHPHGTGVKHYVYRTYLCVGTLNMVTNCLHTIMSMVPR